MDQREYLIGPYDLLEVTVFQVEELSRVVRVNARGGFSLPMVGYVEAAGRTASQVESAIVEKLLECCLQEPQVSIFIKEFVSQRVTVDGEVAKPGIYSLTGRTTLLQALAMAAGAGQLAELSEVRIFRNLADGRKETLLFNIEAIRSGAQVDPVIQGNDVVVVGRSGTLSVIKGVSDTLRGFIGFGTLR
jgi:polysaccharide export outer membrane protein